MGRNLTRKRGGKFLGQGSYGCAFLPTIACEGENITTSDSISKLMRCEDAHDEYSSITNVLKSIDPDQQYFLYPRRICKVDLEDETVPKANIARCGFSGTLQDSLRRNKQARSKSLKPKDPCSAFPDISKDSPVSIQYLYGGKDLYEGRIPRDDAKIFMEDMNNLFQGLAILHFKGYVHFDIKRENAVALKELTGRYKIRFIDFGFLTTPSAFNPRKFDPSGLYYYKFYPYDIRFLNPEFMERNIVPNDISQWYRVKLDSVVIDGLPRESITSVNQNSMIKLYRDLRSLSFNERKDMIMKKADVFMLGIILAEMYKELFGASPSLSANPSTLSYRVAKLAFHMTDGNTLDRYTIDEAYEVYRSIFPRITRPVYTAAHPPPPPPQRRTPPRPMRANEVTPPLPPPPPQPSRMFPIAASYEKRGPPPRLLPRTPPQNNYLEIPIIKTQKPLTKDQEIWGVAPQPKKQKYSRKTRKQRR